MECTKCAAYIYKFRILLAGYNLPKIIIQYYKSIYNVYQMYNIMMYNCLITRPDRGLPR